MFRLEQYSFAYESYRHESGYRSQHDVYYGMQVDFIIKDRYGFSNYNKKLRGVEIYGFSCGQTLQVGQSYLVSARYNKRKKHLEVNLCSGLRRRLPQKHKMTRKDRFRVFLQLKHQCPNSKGWLKRRRRSDRLLKKEIQTLKQLLKKQQDLFYIRFILPFMLKILEFKQRLQRIMSRFSRYRTRWDGIPDKYSKNSDMSTVPRASVIYLIK